MTQRKLEICCGDIQSCRAAVDGGADRIELCSALAVGGLTPSKALIEAAVSIRRSTDIHVLIRPREGDFLYSPDEVAIILEDIRTAREAGAQGVVIGALNADGSIDMDATRVMVEMAGEMNVTFHRAFDLSRDLKESLESVISAGCNRVLTSGGAPTALDGASVLKELNEISDRRITILGGCGVSPENALQILEESGICELHASARSVIKSSMTFQRNGVAMGKSDAEEYSRMTTDINKVKLLSEIIHN